MFTNMFPYICWGYIGYILGLYFGGISENVKTLFWDLLAHTLHGLGNF